MVAGKVPFREKNDSETYKKIMANDYAFPAEFPPEAKELICRLLNPNPISRIGAGIPG